MNRVVKKEWKSFKKWANWNQIKALISGGLPLMVFFFLYIKWIDIVGPIMDKYTKSLPTPETTEQAVFTLCLLAGFVGPIFLSFPILELGSFLGKITKFYRDDRTRYIYFDDVSYFIGDMSQDQRDKIKEILSSYKSKRQLRKEKLATKNWFWRNFG